MDYCSDNAYNYVMYVRYPLSADVGYTPHEGDVTCSRCSVDIWQNNRKLNSGKDCKKNTREN